MRGRASSRWNPASRPQTKEPCLTAYMCMILFVGLAMCMAASLQHSRSAPVMIHNRSAPVGIHYHVDSSLSLEFLKKPCYTVWYVKCGTELEEPLNLVKLKVQGNHEIGVLGSARHHNGRWKAALGTLRSMCVWSRLQLHHCTAGFGAPVVYQRVVRDNLLCCNGVPSKAQVLSLAFYKKGKWKV